VIRRRGEFLSLLDANPSAHENSRNSSFGADTPIRTNRGEGFEQCSRIHDRDPMVEDAKAA
jgi:hypothetical protein